MKQLLSGLCLLFFFSVNGFGQQDANFQGIIKYVHTNEEKGYRDTTIAYYGKEHLRTQRLGRLITDYGGISDVYYDFSTPEQAKLEGIYYKGLEQGMLYDLKPNPLITIEHFQDSLLLFDSLWCKKSIITYPISEFQDAKTSVIETIWTCEDFPFQFPDYVGKIRFHYSEGTHCLILRSERNVKTILPDGRRTNGTSIMQAFEIIPQELDPELLKMPTH